MRPNFRVTFKTMVLNGAFLASLAWTVPAASQGVPTFDSQNLLKQLEITRQLLEDAGVQNQQLAQLLEQVKLLEQQYQKLQDIHAMLSDPTQIIGLVLGDDLDGILEGEFNLEMVSTILKGSRGDWSGISGLSGETFTKAVDSALTSGGTTQEKVTAMANSDNPIAERNATTTTSNAATSAAAEVAYREANQSVERVTQLVTEIGNLDTLKASVDHNTRVTAELAIAMAALWQLESVQTMNVGLTGVADAATLAEIEKFIDFSLPEIPAP